MDSQIQTAGQNYTKDKFCKPDSNFLERSESAREMYDRLPALISEQSLQTVLRKDRCFNYCEEFQYRGKSTEHVFDVDEAMQDLKKMTKSKKFDIDIETKPTMRLSSGDSMFELTCLRDLVDITEGSGWETNEQGKKRFDEHM